MSTEGAAAARSAIKIYAGDECKEVYAGIKKLRWKRMMKFDV
jgi:hypothetical protein